MYFKSHRDVVLRSIKTGMSIQFAKGVPEEVHKSMHQDCIESGLQACTKEGKPLDVEEEPVGQKEEIKGVFAPDDGDARKEAILDALKLIVADNDSKNFTGGGRPTVDAVSQVLGWRVDSKDIGQVWEAHREELKGKA